MCVCSSLVGFEDSTCSFLIAPSLVDSPPLESRFCEGVYCHKIETLVLLIQNI